MTPFMGELLGTMLLILFGDGVCAGVSLNKSKAQNSGWIVIAMGWGLALAIAIFAVGRISGAHLNPAFTIGLAMAGQFPWEKVPSYIAAQFIGAFLGACLVWLQYLPHWKATEDTGAKLGTFATGPAIRSPFANLISEVLATFILFVCILAIGANKFTDGLNPFVVGFLLVGVGLSFGGTTGYAMNPARDLGPRIAHAVLPLGKKGSSDWGYAWIPIVGPLVGGTLGTLFYYAVFGG